MATTESSAGAAHSSTPEANPTSELEHISSIVHRALRSTAEPTPEYVLRGVGLFEIHRDEILSSYRGGGRWLIPSGTESAKVYEVRVGSRPERSRCQCVGFDHHGHCSHVVCAAAARRRSAICDCCGERC